MPDFRFHPAAVCHHPGVPISNKAFSATYTCTCNSYSTVARNLSLKTIPRPRAQPEGERLFSTINPMATVL